MTDVGVEQEAFDAWYYSDIDEPHMTEAAPSTSDIDAHHKYWMFQAWTAGKASKEKTNDA